MVEPVTERLARLARHAYADFGDGSGGSTASRPSIRQQLRQRPARIPGHPLSNAVLHQCRRCYTSQMPTNHRRHAITETDDITNALEIARHTWPELADRPGALLRQLILAGRNTLVCEHAEVIRRRRQAIEKTSGALGGVFGADYLKELRQDWPE